MSIDRYVDVGLSMNPFAAEVTEQNTSRLFVDRGLPEPPAPGHSTLVQVIGNKGAGKTTQVQAWRRRTDGPYHYVPAAPYHQRWAIPPVAPVVYADEIDRLAAPVRWIWFHRLARRRATVVAGTHIDLGEQARKAGLRVITHVLEAADTQLMRKVIQRRFEHVELGQPAKVRLDLADIDEIHRQSAGSLRRAEVLGHELVAERTFAHGSCQSKDVQ